MRIIAVGSSDKFVDGNIQRIAYDDGNIYVRCVAKGRPETTMLTVDGYNYKALRLGNKIYVPDKSAIA